MAACTHNRGGLLGCNQLQTPIKQSKMITAVKVTVRHDSGRKTIKVWAASIDEAKQKVCDFEKCPESAVIAAKVDRLSIYQIKSLSEADAPYFFSRKTMRFFGQTMRDFSVTRWGNDAFKISAKHKHGTTERIFYPFTGKLERIND